jgi:hypothetical protein
MKMACCGKKTVAMPTVRTIGSHDVVKLISNPKIVLNPRTSSVVKKPTRPVNDVEKYRA